MDTSEHVGALCLLPSVSGTAFTDIFVVCTKKDYLKVFHISKSKGGNNTKIHAVVDSNCRPLKFLLFADNLNDIAIAPNLLEGLYLEGAIVLADKAYCSRKEHLSTTIIQTCFILFPIAWLDA